MRKFNFTALAFGLLSVSFALREKWVFAGVMAVLAVVLIVVGRQRRG